VTRKKEKVVRMKNAKDETGKGRGRDERKIG
jgi:hypothetical protein